MPFLQLSYSPFKESSGIVQASVTSLLLAGPSPWSGIQHCIIRLHVLFLAMLRNREVI